MYHHLATRRIALALVLAVTAAAWAQPSPNVNLRGTVSRVTANELQIKTREGADVTVTLPDNVPVAITRPFTLAEVQPGMLLGVTTQRQGSGSLVALDVRPIPPSAQQGLSPWDLRPESTMTNATAEGVVQGQNGQEIVLQTAGNTIRARLTPETTYSRAAPGERSDLKLGETIFLVARPDASGRLTALRMQVGKDGLRPTQ
jgi:hypothetical protein